METNLKFSSIIHQKVALINRMTKGSFSFSKTLREDLFIYYYIVASSAENIKGNVILLIECIGESLSRNSFLWNSFIYWNTNSNGRSQILNEYHCEFDKDDDGKHIASTGLFLDI